MGQLQSAFPQQAMVEMNPIAFQSYVATHSDYGRLLTGPILAATVSAAKNENEDIDSHAAADEEKPMPLVCRNRPITSQSACRDSVLTATYGPRALREIKQTGRQGINGNATDSSESNSEVKLDGGLKVESHPDSLSDFQNQPDASETKERVNGLASNFAVDASSGNWDMGGDKWAAVIYVVVGVVVVGAFVIYGIQAVYELMTNQNDRPVFKEFSLRYSYSGRRWDDGGPNLYRNANLIGLHYGTGLDHGGWGVGLALEGGYIDLSLRGINDPASAFFFKGGYFVAGPLVRFGDNKPLSFTLEFLNGTSDQPSIGWISKSRMTLEGRPGPSGLLIGAHVGAVFYDLQFFDGLAQRSGNFNRDLSMISGLDMGWEF